MAENEKDKIWEIIESINNLWTNGQAEHLGPFYDDKVIHADKEFETLTSTKDELLYSFKSFCDNARINSFAESEQEIEVIGTTAVASYTWSIKYDMNAKSYDEKGKELLVFSKETGKWLVVWRVLLPDKKSNSEESSEG